MSDKIKINCPLCKGDIFVDFWKLESTHKILCPNCKKFFKLKVEGDTPQKIKSGINNMLKKAFRKLK